MADDKKLLEWVEKRMTDNDKKDNPIRVFPHLGYCIGTASICQFLREAIQNGEFEPEPCILCMNPENEANGILVKNMPFCHSCGRKLKIAKDKPCDLIDKKKLVKHIEEQIKYYQKMVRKETDSESKNSLMLVLDIYKRELPLAIGTFYEPEELPRKDVKK